MKLHHLILCVLCALILAGGSFTCESGDDDDDDGVSVSMETPTAAGGA